MDELELEQLVMDVNDCSNPEDLECMLETLLLEMGVEVQTFNDVVVMSDNKGLVINGMQLKIS